jgi:methionyl-tRNA formyltransferase
MRIVVLCATDRGARALDSLFSLAPDAEFVVATFPETPHEPRYEERICALCEDRNCEFIIQTDLSKKRSLARPFDLMFCFSWRYMVPEEVYSRARLGAYVVHDSLLPKYRGFSPAVWALINGEKEVGVTLFEMAEEVDSGRIVGQRAIPVTDDDDIGTIREKGTVEVVNILEEQFSLLAAGKATLIEQDESEATYTCKWVPADARIRWDMDRQSILNLVRATTAPYPGAYCYLGENKFTVWKAGLPVGDRDFVSRRPGAVCGIHPDGSVGVLTGDRELTLIEVSLQDGPKVPASELLHSLSIRLT